MFNHSHMLQFSSFSIDNAKIQAKILRAGSPDVFMSMVETYGECNRQFA